MRNNTDSFDKAVSKHAFEDGFLLLAGQIHYAFSEARSIAIGTVCPAPTVQDLGDDHKR